MYLRYLAYLRLVIEHGSFAAAAQASGVSQPAISHGMKQLQRQFAAPLLVRSGRRYVPTELALHVASASASLAEQVDALATARPRQPNRDVLQIGLTPSAALIFGPILFNSWCVGHPRRFLELTSADEGSLLAGLQTHKFDAVISPKPRGHLPSGVAGHSLYQIEPLIYARRAHPCVGAQTLAELQGAAWASVGPSVRGPVDILTEAYAVRKMPPPRVAVSCPDYASMLNLVADTDLLAVVPHPALIGEVRKRITPLRLREALPLYEMWVFESPRSRRRMRPIVQRLLDVGQASRKT
ncbi:LysR family transcriptional regulator [Ralstonia solanacearum]|uniref:LysR family transcriptional regulator n=1 Tax=Ralstonia solanacearum TaxID=305 RepID=A0AAD0WJ13_RALSL|nr:LysR family transcriptional regulator [Ralstonia solanacearum]AXV83807.1 LysR family transcriptional regulator [Ralstonia solanacearum]AXW54939.1 LysR family transcriptional regulator [Ralstonia solanacearum]CBJ35048.1 putative transcription regulator protein, LysR family [Ralstonia solanacearum PSI07]